MNVPDGLISSDLLWLNWLLFIALMGLGVYRSPWRALLHAPQRLNLIAASVVFLAMLWLFSSSALPGLSLHFLGLTVVTLVVGWPLALVVGGVTLLLLSLAGQMAFSGIGLDMLGMVVPPVLVTALINAGAQKLLPANYFIYLFVNSFLSAILGAMAAALASASLMLVFGIYTWDVLTSSYFPLLPIQWVPEAMINTMIILGLTLLRPDWVITFDDQRYFKN
ncbi:energy-coupling factor ABC transporter permease [Halothiobacillus neapolitanus]|uniref:Putative integral membrane protein n=1 Tax=Halothiobacillus neapolitanus (strain ATCC 23641 / DSM 15147 / CIP 104769 / NCIMB 8539 / c2) TaxID=555778 RepID=D0KXB2_HALNC|nr:energy-coupling factor ABC transporter permease [Halothiobacillus neapolitanus]ACX95126.1 putative integral membrane protein [Halothiobacillus neapolitanus c2]TDN60920.1 putative membrane protein [Halothiobacillus neapolitanus]